MCPSKEERRKKKKNTWSDGKSNKIPYPDANTEINKQATITMHNYKRFPNGNHHLPRNRRKANEVKIK